MRKKESVTLGVSRWPVLSDSYSSYSWLRTTLAKASELTLSALIVEFCEVITID